MKNFITPFVIRNVLRHKKGFQHKKNFSRFEIAKGYLELRISFRRNLKDSFFIFFGIIAAGIGLESFLLPNKFIDGGVTGISLLTAEVTKLHLSYFLVLINIPFIFLGMKFIGRAFAIKTAIAITGLAILISVVHFPEVTHDKLLVAVFGGFFLGSGIGLSIRGGAVLDGTEILAIYLSRKFHTTVGDIIIIFNIIIFSFAALSDIIAEFPVGSSIINFCFSWPHITLCNFLIIFFYIVLTICSDYEKIKII